MWGYGALQRPRHGETEVRADLGAGNSPACDVLAPGVVYSFHNLAQKKRGDLEVLTKAGIRTGRPCREIGGEDRRWRSSELLEKAEAVRPRASGVCGSTREDPVMVQRGSGWPELQRGRGIMAPVQLTGGGVQGKIPAWHGSDLGLAARGGSWARGGASVVDSGRWWCCGTACLR